MKTQIRHLITVAFAITATLCITTRASAQTTVGIDPSASWLGFMNVFELPSNGGGYVFGSSWGTADLVATFSGPILTLAPNTIGDPSTFWYVGGGGPGAQGNKNMDANMYVEQTGLLSGQNVTFTGTVMANTLVSPYTSVAFIKDFAPDYSSSVTVSAPLTAGVFNISLSTLPGAGRHVQYGFETIGPDVWVTDVGPYGSIQLTAVPEPSTLTIAALGALGGVAALRRQRR